MFQKSLVLQFTALLIILLLMGCQNTAETAPADFEQPTNIAPALWKVSAKQGGASAYLFGSIHILPQDIEWRSAEFDDAVRASDRLVLEIDPLETPDKLAQSFHALARTPDQLPITDRINPDLRDEAASIMGAYNLPASSFNDIESWGAALMITASLSNSSGARRDFGVEKTLTREFQARRKPVSGLESAVRQFGYFDRLPEADQRAMLESVIENADKAALNYRKLLKTWLSGDMDAIAALGSQGFLARPNIRRSIVTARNTDWAAQIDAMLNTKDTTYFIAVGAGHFAGDDALHDVLADKGHTVTRIQ